MTCTHNGLHPRILDYRRIPLRLGGLSSADDGLFDFDIGADDDIIKLHGAVTDPWVDKYLRKMWGAPSGSVPYIGRFTHYAVSVASATAATTAPHLWSIAADDWYIDFETDEMKYRQEVGTGLGLPPVPQVSGLAAFDSDQTTQTEIVRVAGAARKTPFRIRELRVDFETATSFTLSGTATSNNSTSFGANANVTLWLWGLLARKGDTAMRELDGVPATEPEFMGATINNAPAQRRRAG